jgi:glycosyl transferase family 25
MKNFIICLSNVEASLKTATDLKNQLESYGETVELFEGTYGTDAVTQMTLENRTIHPWGIKGPNAISYTDTPDRKSQTPGVKGCFYSHYNLWKKCVELNEPIIIWEDDIVLSRPYQIIDWEDVLVLALGHPTKTEKYRHYLETPEGDPIAETYYQGSMPGCCGYAIKPHAAEKLLEVYKNTYLPADNAINQHIVRIQIHNYVMGIALIKKDGKKSLTRTTFWDTYKS